MNVYRLLSESRAEGLIRLSRDADSPEPRGVKKDRFGVLPSVFGVMLGLPPVREGVRERDERLFAGLRPISERFRVLEAPVLCRRALSGLLENPASPALDREFAEGTRCRFVDGVANGERVAEEALGGAVMLGDRLTDGLGAGAGDISRRGATVAGVRLGAADDRAFAGELGRLTDGGAVFREGAALGVRLIVGARDGVAGLILRGVNEGLGAGARLPPVHDREGVTGAADDRLGELKPLDGDRKTRGAGVADRLDLAAGADCRRTEGAKDRLIDGLDDRRLNDGPDERRLTEGDDDRRADLEAARVSA